MLICLQTFVCDCKGTPFWQTDKTFTQLFSKQYASLIFTHYIYNKGNLWRRKDTFFSLNSTHRGEIYKKNPQEAATSWGKLILI